MKRRRPGFGCSVALLAISSVCLIGVAVPAAQAACPIGAVITVDNDLPGSGYSEVSPQNWISHNVGACQGNYRYLSHTVGDGTRKGKAIWAPKITVDGWYDVVVSYRASVNRTNDADYLVEDDAGATHAFVVDQQQGTDCTKKKLGNFFCKAGGACRVVLDGTDDGNSDAADATTFTLTQCSGTPPPPGPCAGIKSNPAYELCGESATTCSGVFTNGSGCVAFCAAAGMLCTARFGGEPGCQKEPTNPIACLAQNGNASDWCECAAPATPDAGTPPADQGVTPADQGVTPADAKPVAPRDGGADSGARDAASDALAAPDLARPDGGSSGQISGGCAIGELRAGLRTPVLLPTLLLLALRLRARRRRSTQNPAPSR